jgi:ataxia telangiectasia mutated family protein
MFGKENSDISSNVGIPTITESDNDAATRTIAKINEKLQGYEEGTFGEQQTVEGQVRLLINAARNPDNLCSLFVGWMPWL